MKYSKIKMYNKENIEWFKESINEMSFKNAIEFIENNSSHNNHELVYDILDNYQYWNKETQAVLDELDLDIRNITNDSVNKLIEKGIIINLSPNKFLEYLKKGE